MSTTAVLYDVAGPRARRRALVGTVVVVALVAAALYWAFQKLDRQGQFTMGKWGPLIDPSTPEFALVWKQIGLGLRATLIAAVLAIMFALICGTVLGVARMMLSGTAGRIPLVTVIELLRGLPVVVTIYLCYQVLPEAGIDVGPLPGPDGLWYLVLALTLYNSVIIAEILRAGVASLPRGQREAGLANGFTNLQTMRLILLPQAFRAMLPALISQLVVVLKDTSLAALFALYEELLRRGLLIKEVLGNPLQVLFIIGLIFIALNFALSLLATYVQKRLARGRRPVEPVAVVALGGPGVGLPGGGRPGGAAPFEAPEPASRP